MQVLVVDDEIAIVDLVADMLSDEGHEVAKAHDGRGALSLLRAGLRPQVVITDMMMPNLDGMGLYHAIRNEIDHHTGVLLMSAGKRFEMQDPRARFLAKPFSLDDLLDALEMLAD